MDDDEILFEIMLHDLQDAEQQAEIEDRKMWHSSRRDPLEDLSNANFMKLFRLNKDLCRMVIETLINIQQPPPVRKSALDIKTKVGMLNIFMK